MQEMNFSRDFIDTTFKCIIEPLKETDEVYVVSDGKVYKWDNSVVSVTDEYLAHFKEVKNIDCSVFNSCSNSNTTFIDIVEEKATELNVGYESNNKKPFKTEFHLLNYFVKHCDLFPDNWEKVTIEDNINDIAEWIINVNKEVAKQLIPDEYKNDLPDNNTHLKKVFISILTLSLKDDKVNKLLAIIKAVKDYCDKLKAAKEAKKQSDNKEEKKSDES